MKQYSYKINGVAYTVEIDEITDEQVEVKVNGKSYSVELEKKEQKPVQVKRPVVPRSAPAAPKPSAPKPSAAAAGGVGINSPLPGVIVAVNVAVGDSVTAGQSLLTLEAMKMENNIEADSAGKVVSISVKPGDSVMEGDLLITIGE